MSALVLEPDEAYARQKLAGMTAEGRTAYAGMSDDELIEAFRADYWADVDSGLGELDALGTASVPPASNERAASASDSASENPRG